MADQKGEKETKLKVRFQPIFSAKDSESQAEKLKYPIAIPFIIANEFCERFCYYGMRAILVLYLKQKLMFEEGDATVIFHVFSLMVYFSCIIGAILADGFIGKFNTIFLLSIVYAGGSTVVAVGAIEMWNMPARWMTFIGLALIAIGSGGIKPCVSAFGGEQFKRPEQEKQLLKFFSMFYFSINAGSLISSWITPILREDVHCFEEVDCFPASFGLPAALMILATVIFLSGKCLYKINRFEGNSITNVLGCIWTALMNRRQEKKINPKEHWLEYAQPKYGRRLVLETKIVLNVLVLFLPLPLFWALFDQQGSRWTFQATRMDGDIGWFIIKPDQMQVINPLLILTFVPLFEFAFYPVLHFIGLRKPLQKMALGGILAGFSFLCSMAVQFAIDKGEPISILWQIPQYVTMSLGEVMFSIIGLEFSFTQAPESMKTIIGAFWLLTVAGGNLLVVLVVSSRLLENQAIEFLLFAVLMFIDMLIFLWLGILYKPIPLEELDKIED